MKNQNIVAMRTVMSSSVLNMEGEYIGQIEEIMIDFVTGKIAYAVLSFGGFMGFGDKYFAIPWEKLILDHSQKSFRLDVTKESLKHSPGFDKDNWPDFADVEFLDAAERHYAKTGDPIGTRYGEFSDQSDEQKNIRD